MKILVLVHEFPPVGGGGGRVAQDIASGLAARGHEVHILTANLAGLAASERLDGVQVTRLPSGRKEAFRAEFAEMAAYDWQVIKAGRQLMRSWKPDVIHAHFAVPAGAAALALSRLSGIPYVLTAHLGDVPGALPEKTDRWFKWVFPFTPPIWRSAARLVAVSEFTKTMALKHYAFKMQVIPNGVQLAALPASQPKSEKSAPRIVFAGRFMEQKNPMHLVQALARLRHLSWSCAMLGDGPLLEPVRAELQRSGLAERFWLPGWLTPEQVLGEFSRSDVLVLPSHAEGLSVVAVQALGMGLALLLSAAGGNQELVQDGQNGFIFPVGDIDVLSDRLEKLILTPSMLQSAQAKSRVMAQKYDLPGIVSQYENLFSSIQSKK